MRTLRVSGIVGMLVMAAVGGAGGVGLARVVLDAPAPLVWLLWLAGVGCGLALDAWIERTGRSARALRTDAVGRGETERVSPRPAAALAAFGIGRRAPRVDRKFSAASDS